ERLVVASPAGGEVIGEGAPAVAGRPRQPLGDVEGAGVDRVRAVRGLERGPDRGRRGRLDAPDEGGARPGTGGAGGQDGGEAPRGGDAAGRQYRDGDSVEHLLQQRQGGDGVAAVPAGLGAAGDDHVGTGTLGGGGLGGGSDLH